MHSFMPENIMAETTTTKKCFSKTNIDYAMLTEPANMPLMNINVDRPYPFRIFLTNSVYHLMMLLMMLFFITSNHFPFKKKHRRV